MSGRTIRPPLPSVLMAVMVVGAGALPAHGMQPMANLFDASRPQGAGSLQLQGSAEVRAGPLGQQLELPAGASAAWQPVQPLHSAQGSILLWIEPLWSADDTASHTLLTFGWSGADHSYFALSQGWWEPEGSRRLYAVASNQDHAFCLTPWTFDYGFFLDGQTTLVAVTWQSGNPGNVRLYVDGKKICDRPFAGTGTRVISGPLFIGSDRGATDQRQRRADFRLRSLELYGTAMTDTDVRRRYLERGGDERSKWITAIIGNAGAQLPGTIPDERRVMFDEDTAWADSRAEIRRRVDRVKSAGFNIYVPCVWDGGEARFRTAAAPMARSARPGVAGAFDPLQYLLSYAHQVGIRVYPWFVVARRISADFPPEYFEGAPPQAFNVQNPGFRDFIVGLVGGVAARYEVDGINLDYIRSIGVCSSAACAAAYHAQFGRSLADDWRDAMAGQSIGALETWNRVPITDIVERVAQAARATGREIVVSVDTVAGDRERRLQGVDEESWVRAGLVDLVVHMAYDDPVDIATVNDLRRALPADKIAVAFRNYDIFGSEVVARRGALVADYLRLWRRLWSGSAIAFYHYPHLTDEQVRELHAAVAGPAASPGFAARR